MSSAPRSNVSTTGSSVGPISRVTSTYNAGAVVPATPLKDVRSQVYETLARVGVPEKICQFFADVLQTEYDMNVTVDRLLHRLRNFDGRPLDPEAAFKVTQELTKNFHTWKNSLDSLAIQGRELPSLTVDPVTMNDSMVALCGYQSHGMDMHLGDEMQIVDSSQPGKILVRSITGQQGYIPALCCLLPSPDYTPKATIRRLKVQLLAQWTESVKAIQIQLSHCLSSTVASLTKHWRTQCAHSCGKSRDRVTRRLKKVTDTLNKARGNTHSTPLDYTRLHTTLFSLEKELMSLEQRPEVEKMMETVANLDRAILCYQMLHKQWQQHREALEHEKQPIRVMETWPARAGKNIKYYEYKVTLENVNVREEISVVQPDDGKARSQDSIKKWIDETSKPLPPPQTTIMSQSQKIEDLNRIPKPQVPLTKTITETVTTYDETLTETEESKTRPKGNRVVPNGNVLKVNLETGELPPIIGGTRSENEARLNMIDQWVSSTVTDTTSLEDPDRKPRTNGHREEQVTETDEWFDTEEHTEQRIPVNNTEVPTHPEDRWTTDEWTEETKTKFTREDFTDLNPAQEDTTVYEQVIQVNSEPPANEEEQWTTNEWTEVETTQYIKEVSQEHPSDNTQVFTELPVEETIITEQITQSMNDPPANEEEQWRTEEWTEVERTQYSSEVNQEYPAQNTQPPSQFPVEDTTVTEQVTTAMNAPPQEEEQWRTEEWTEIERTQYTNETNQEFPVKQEPQEEQWRTDEWTEEKKIQFTKEVDQEVAPKQDEEQWRTDEWTEEKKIQFTKEVDQEVAPKPEEEQWRTDEWTEERKIQFEKDIEKQVNDLKAKNEAHLQNEEQWRTEEWTEERKIQFERENNNEISGTKSQIEPQQVKAFEAPKYEASRKGSIQSATIREVQPLSCQSDSPVQVVRRLSEVKHVTQFIKAEEASLDQQDGKIRQQTFVPMETGGALAQTEGVETVEGNANEEVDPSEEEREWTVTSGVTETVMTDQITSAQGEETRKFMIRAVVEPRTGKDISVQEAHRKGIIVDEEGVYYNDQTGTKIPIQEAMNRQLIKVAYQTANKSKEKVQAIGMVTIKYSIDPMINKVIDESTGEELSCEDAQLKGILDQKCEIYTKLSTGERVTIDEATENGWLKITPGEFRVKTYAVSAVMDQRTRRKIPFADAVERDLFDRNTGHYVNNITGERVYVADAINRGYLQAKLVENNDTLDIEAENKIIVDRMENMRSTVLEKIGKLADSLDQLNLQ